MRMCYYVCMTENPAKNHPLVQTAIEFATAAHESIGQRRKYSDEPYIVHPLHVMDLLLAHAVNAVTPEMLAAAACHDTVEDTPVTIEQVRVELGDKVGDLVGWLTDVSQPEHGNRKTRKEMDLVHTSQAPAQAHTIKCADIVSNAPSITEHNPGFARKWLAEAAAILAVCSDADPGVLAEAQRVVQECLNSSWHSCTVMAMNTNPICKHATNM